MSPLVSKLSHSVEGIRVVRRACIYIYCMYMRALYTTEWNRKRPAVDNPRQSFPSDSHCLLLRFGISSPKLMISNACWNRMKERIDALTAHCLANPTEEPAVKRG